MMQLGTTNEKNWFRALTLLYKYITFA